jgi:hypothetical protein
MRTTQYGNLTRKMRMGTARAIASLTLGVKQGLVWRRITLLKESSTLERLSAALLSQWRANHTNCLPRFCKSIIRGHRSTRRLISSLILCAIPGHTMATASCECRREARSELLQSHHSARSDLSDARCSCREINCHSICEVRRERVVGSGDAATDETPHQGIHQICPRWVS